MKDMKAVRLVDINGRSGPSSRGWGLPVMSVLGITSVLVASCGSSSASTSTTTQTRASTDHVRRRPHRDHDHRGRLRLPGADGPVKGLGTVLVDGKGMTLYLFVPDTQMATSTCYSACAQAWPPLLLPAGVTSPFAGPGVQSSLLGTTHRSDGTTQITYNKWPLYLWVGDSQPGQATGQGINNYGGLWYVLSPADRKSPPLPELPLAARCESTVRCCLNGIATGFGTGKKTFDDAQRKLVPFGNLKDRTSYPCWSRGAPPNRADEKVGLHRQMSEGDAFLSGRVDADEEGAALSGPAPFVETGARMPTGTSLAPNRLRRPIRPVATVPIERAVTRARARCPGRRQLRSPDCALYRDFGDRLWPERGDPAGLVRNRTAGATAAALIANVAATIPSYLMSRYWIWKDAERTQVGRQVVLYWATSAASIILTSLATGALAKLIPVGERFHLALIGVAFFLVNVFFWFVKVRRLPQVHLSDG